MIDMKTMITMIINQRMIMTDDEHQKNNNYITCVIQF